MTKILSQTGNRIHSICYGCDLFSVNFVTWPKASAAKAYAKLVNQITVLVILEFVKFLEAKNLKIQKYSEEIQPLIWHPSVAKIWMFINFRKREWFLTH